MSKDDLIKILSHRDLLLDFMEKYNITGLREATVEQLEEYLMKEVLHEWDSSSG